MPTVSKAYLLADGSSAALGASDEGVLFSSAITSINFVGDSVAASTDPSGNVTVQVFNTPAPSLVDGGNF